MQVYKRVEFVVSEVSTLSHPPRATAYDMAQIPKFKLNTGAEIPAVGKHLPHVVCVPSLVLMCYDYLSHLTRLWQLGWHDPGREGLRKGLAPHCDQGPSPHSGGHLLRRLTQLPQAGFRHIDTALGYGTAHEQPECT